MSAEDDGRTSIYVIAGVNGAGKSSVVGEHIVLSGAKYYNPDLETREILKINPDISLDEANVEAWKWGKHLLERAIRERGEFSFETTLGGSTITNLLEDASDAGLPVRMWFVGLNSVELHISRVRERVERGGHDIPEAKIRERYIQSRKNVIRLLPKLAELRLFDNSAERNPARGEAPQPVLLLHVVDGWIKHAVEKDAVPAWATAIFDAVSEFPSAPPE